MAILIASKGSIMTINLPDLPQAVRAYLDTKVAIQVSEFTPAAGDSINPGETFTFSVRVTNASAANGGVALTNVRYHVLVSNANVTVRVPTGGSSLDGSGQPIEANDDVRFFNFNPAGNLGLSYLQLGETQSLMVTGTAGTNPAGGTSAITARIEADPDINALFPRNETTPTAFRNISVVG
jgi:hypothetical protein